MVLVAELTDLECAPSDILVRLRLKHWAKGPVGRVKDFASIDVRDHVFRRSAFEIHNPRRATVLSGITTLTNGRCLVVQCVVGRSGLEGEFIGYLFEQAFETALLDMEEPM